MADIHKDRVLASYESLWTSRLYSDLIIRCGSNEYKVHQSVICPRSVFFTKACNGVLKEAKTATTIIMDDDDPQTLRRMLSYLYTLDYSDGRLPDDPVETVVTVPALPPHLRHKIQTKTSGEARSGGTSPIIEAESLYDPKRLNNVLVYALADKYDIPELKELAKRKFHALMKTEWTSMEFQAVTDAVFGTTLSQDTSLRYIMSQICMDHFQNIIKDVRVRSVILGNKDVTHALLEYATVEPSSSQAELDAR